GAAVGGARLVGNAVERAEVECGGVEQHEAGHGHILPRVADTGQTGGVDPHAALSEIADLLERERSSRYKSKAFRNAAAVVATLAPDELGDAATLRRR